MAELKPIPTEHPMTVREIHRVSAPEHPPEYWLKQIAAQLAEHNEQMRALNLTLASLEREFLAGK